MEVVGLLSIAISVVLRTVVSIDPFPYWSGNPLESWIGLTGLSPVGQLACDAATTIGAGILLWGLARRGLACACWQLAAIVPGIVVVMWWGLAHGGSVDHLLTGMPWVAGICTAASISIAMRLPQARRVVTGIVMGICAMLAMKALVQVLVEHPNLVREFKENRQAIFASNGWTPDSSMARAYERRVMQNEATGWFGLANPFATIGAAVVVFAAAIALPLKGEKVHRGIALTLLLVGAIITVLAGAKGGYAAVAVGLAVLACGYLANWSKLSTTARAIFIRFGFAPVGMACVAVPLVLVIIRGLIGDRLSELSIWFRAMYLEAALRIFTEQPWLGVGPAGFKDAYLIAKNPLNPEEVASPHSVIADFASTLGVSGILLGAFVVGMAILAMRQVGSGMAQPADANSHPSSNDDQEGIDRRLIAAAMVLPVLIAAYLERDVATVENLIVRVVGLALAVIVAIHVSALSPRRLAIASGAAALAALAHAQIEMTPILAASSGWFWLLIGAGSGVLATTKPSTPLRKSSAVIGPISMLLAGGIVLAGAMPGIVRWNTALRDAAFAVRPIAEVKVLLAQGSRDPSAMKDALEILAQATGKRVGPNEKEVSAAIQTMLESGTDKASRELMKARNEGSAHYGTARAYSQLLMFRADLAMQRGDLTAADELANFAIAAVDERCATSDAARWGWIGTLWVERARRGLGGIEALVAADKAFAESVKRDPWSLNPLLRQIEVVKNLGQNDRSADLARRALELHKMTRLDPLKGLTPTQEAELTRLAEGAKSPAGSGK
jgi:O-antigen ligase